MSFVSRSLHAPLKRAQSSGDPDHWRVYCLARNKASNAVKAAKKKHLKVYKQRYLPIQTALPQSGCEYLKRCVV